MAEEKITERKRGEENIIESFFLVYKARYQRMEEFGEVKIGSEIMPSSETLYFAECVLSAQNHPEKMIEDNLASLAESVVARHYNLLSPPDHVPTGDSITIRYHHPADNEFMVNRYGSAAQLSSLEFMSLDQKEKERFQSFLQYHLMTNNFVVITDSERSSMDLYSGNTFHKNGSEHL